MSDTERIQKYDSRESSHRKPSSSGSHSRREKRSEDGHRHRRHHHHHRHHRHHRERDSDSRSSRHRSRSAERPHRHRKSDESYRSRSSHVKERNFEVVEDDEEGQWVIEDKDFFSSGGEEAQPVFDTIATDNLRISKLNKLKAEIYKAELKGDEEKLKQLSTEYADLDESKAQPQQVPNVNVENTTVKIIDQRFLPTSQTQGSSEDASIHEMLREELETRGQDLFGKKLAQEITKDGVFRNDTDYQDDVAEKLAKMRKDTDQAIRSRAISQTKKLNDIIDKCWLCIDGKPSPSVTVISMATRTYLCLPPEPEIAKGTCAIVPLDHHTNTLECDDDEWEEIRNFMKSLTAMWAAQGKDVIFYESAVSRSPQKHASIFAVPVPSHIAADAPGYFHQAFNEQSDQWRDHQAVTDTRNRGKNGFRSLIAKQAPYFHAWFDINGGLGHIVESKSWPSGDRFGRQVLGGMLGVDPTTVRKRGEWVCNPQSKSAEYFRMRWRAHDWTVALNRS